MFVSITRLHLRSIWYLPHFFWMNERTVRQIRRSIGFREGRLLADSDLTFWTLTLWDSNAAMRAFRDSGAHRVVMPKLLTWCDEASVAQMTDRAALPDWEEGHGWMRAHGHASKLRHPSPHHAGMDFGPPRSRLARPLMPKLSAS
jgi:hypothetical protein